MTHDELRTWGVCLVRLYPLRLSYQDGVALAECWGFSKPDAEAMASVVEAFRERGPPDPWGPPEIFTRAIDTVGR